MSHFGVVPDHEAPPPFALQVRSLSPSFSSYLSPQEYVALQLISTMQLPVYVMIWLAPCVSASQVTERAVVSMTGAAVGCEVSIVVGGGCEVSMAVGGCEVTGTVTTYRKIN